MADPNHALYSLKGKPKKMPDYRFCTRRASTTTVFVPLLPMFFQARFRHPFTDIKNNAVSLDLPKSVERRYIF